MWLDIARYCGVVSTLLAGVLTVFVHPRINSRNGIAMALYFYLRAATEILSFVTSAYNINNMLLFYLFCLFETMLVTYIFTQPYYMKPYLKIIWAFAILILAGIILEPLLTSTKEINTYSRLAESIFFFLLCGFVASKILRSPHKKLMYKLPEYWLSSGLMFYFGIHLWVALSSNYFIHAYKNAGGALIWSLNSVATLITNLFILCCLYFLYHKPTSPD